MECTYRTISVSSYSVSVLIDDEIVGNSILVTAYASIEPSSGEVAFVFGFCLFCISIIAISIVFVIIFMRHPVIKAASPMIIFSILFGFGLQLAGVLVLFEYVFRSIYLVTLVLSHTRELVVLLLHFYFMSDL